MGGSQDMIPDSPFPEVAAALRPYIKTRQDAMQIRQTLYSTLPLSTLHTPQSSLPKEVDPSGLTGIRKTYWRALQAHEAAQSKYDCLKIELEQVIRQQPDSQQDLPNFDDPSQLLVASYVPLLRQREKHRKLTVIDKASARINVTGGDAVTDSFDKIVKRKVGELPTPPSATAFPDRETGPASELDLTELKRAVLSVQHQVDEHESFIRDSGEHAPMDNPHAILQGLQKAHHELTIWMETQLGLIHDVTTPKENGDSTGGNHKTDGDAVDTSAEIESLYETYLDVRQRLLSTVAQSTNNREAVSLQDSQSRGSNGLEAEQRITASEILLPHLSKMLTVKEYEQTLLQQNAYTRRQLASAELQTQAVLTRLADESHLIEPGLSRAARHGKDWYKASELATDAINKSVMQRLTAGKGSARMASTTLDAIRGIPSSLDSFFE